MEGYKVNRVLSNASFCRGVYENEVLVVTSYLERRIVYRQVSCFGNL